jgi:catechol 2,3-dioxygenase-like lactoylglutathione lyase family enzyme
MNIKGFRWVGVSTAQFDQMSIFLVKTLGLRPGTSTTDFLEVLTSGGDRLELNGPGAENPPWEFKPNALMIGFLVDDVRAARQELLGVPGVELLGSVQTENGFVWQDFRAPDGNVYELTSDPKPE